MSAIVEALKVLRANLATLDRENRALRIKRRTCIDCGSNLYTPATERLATAIAKGDGKWFAALPYEERERYEAMAREVEAML